MFHVVHVDYVVFLEVLQDRTMFHVIHVDYVIVLEVS